MTEIKEEKKDEEKRSTFTLELPPEEDKTLKIYCIMHNKRYNQVVIEAIREWLESHKNELKKIRELAE